MQDSDELKSKMAGIREFFSSRQFWKPFLAVIIGGVLGFAYYYFVGCQSGSCAITSNPWKSTMMGGFLGFFLTNSPCAKGKC